MSAVTKVSRRSFLQTTGLAGSALVLGVRGGWSSVAPVPGLGMEPNGFEPNVWVSIGEDGVVQLTVHRQELGQGEGHNHDPQRLHAAAHGIQAPGEYGDDNAHPRHHQGDAGRQQ